MYEGECLDEIFNRFRNITNELSYIGVIIPQGEELKNYLNLRRENLMPL